jgi:hypothetical protein
MKDGLFTQNPEYHEGTFIEEDDDLIHFLDELKKFRVSSNNPLELFEFEFLHFTIFYY